MSKVIEPCFSGREPGEARYRRGWSRAREILSRQKPAIIMPLHTVARRYRLLGD